MRLNAFLARAGEAVQPGQLVLDAGAGRAPYRDLFSHARYETADFLAVQGKKTEANALLAPLSTEHHFYGLLATEDLGETIGAPIAMALGVPIAPLALLVAVEMVPDIFRTLGNVTMDVAVTAVVDRSAEKGPDS